MSSNNIDNMICQLNGRAFDDEDWQNYMGTEVAVDGTERIAQITVIMWGEVDMVMDDNGIQIHAYAEDANCTWCMVQEEPKPRATQALFLAMQIASKEERTAIMREQFDVLNFEAAEPNSSFERLGHRLSRAVNEPQ